MTPSSAVPSPAELHPTLCDVTQRLACELAKPSQIAPQWTECEWTIARAVAAMHGISPLLSRALPWRGPDSWANFLSEQRMHTRARHVRIQELLQSIDGKASGAELAVTALKGAALHELGLYEPGDRPMADIDLLVRRVDMDRASRLLSELGFRQSGESWKELIFTPVDYSPAAELGEHSGNNLKIELHDRICEKLPLRMTDVSRFVFPAKLHPGLNKYPSMGSLMGHLLLHAAGSMAFQGLRILQLHDISLLSCKMSDSDWDQVVAMDRPWWAYPPLEMVSRYYPGSVPQRVLLASQASCAYLLRTLSARRSLVDVSYSYLWVRAFPGIDWSQSIPEMLRFAASRVRPNKKHMAFREQVAASEVWASQGDWSGLSQTRRIVRWLASRQARPATMHVIAAAFAQS